MKFCCKLGKNFTETFQLLNQAYGEDCMIGSLLPQRKAWMIRSKIKVFVLYFVITIIIFIFFAYLPTKLLRIDQWRIGELWFLLWIQNKVLSKIKVCQFVFSYLSASKISITADIRFWHSIWRSCTGFCLFVPSSDKFWLKEGPLDTKFLNP